LKGEAKAVAKKNINSRTMTQISNGLVCLKAFQASFASNSVTHSSLKVEMLGKNLTCAITEGNALLMMTVQKVVTDGR